LLDHFGVLIKAGCHAEWAIETKTHDLYSTWVGA
jgi:hypothetical protein